MSLCLSRGTDRNACNWQWPSDKAACLIPGLVPAKDQSSSQDVIVEGVSLEGGSIGPSACSPSEDLDRPTEQSPQYLCDSVCCSSELVAFQPADKETLESLSMSGGNFMATWYNQYPWLTICTVRKKVFCLYCRHVEKHGMLSFSKKGESAFTTIGYDNWKKALEKFGVHNCSDTHKEAKMKWNQIYQHASKYQHACTICHIPTYMHNMPLCIHIRTCMHNMPGSCSMHVQYNAAINYYYCNQLKPRAHAQLLCTWPAPGTFRFNDRRLFWNGASNLLEEASHLLRSHQSYVEIQRSRSAEGSGPTGTPLRVVRYIAPLCYFFICMLHVVVKYVFCL